MLKSGKVRFTRRAPAFDLDVVVLVRAVWYRCVKQVWQAHQQLCQLTVKVFGFIIQARNVFFLRPNKCAQTLKLGLIT